METGKFADKIIGLYEERGRDFPWRTTDNTMHALASEVMLQQTSYYQVEPVYSEFCSIYQQPQDVIRAGVTEIEELIEPLGLTGRADYIMAVAKHLRKDGSLDRGKLLEVKGLGRYTVNAFLSIHEGERLPIVDGNVIRVFEEELGKAGLSSTDEESWELARKLLPSSRVREYNLGLIDYGAQLYDGNP